MFAWSCRSIRSKIIKIRNWSKQKFLRLGRFELLAAHYIVGIENTRGLSPVKGIGRGRTISTPRFPLAPRPRQDTRIFMIFRFMIIETLLLRFLIWLTHRRLKLFTKILMLNLLETRNKHIKSLSLKIWKPVWHTLRDSFQHVFSLNTTKIILRINAFTFWMNV